MLRRILLLMSGNAFRSVLVFIRTIIVIRLISVADVGIGATFMIAVSVVQMLSDLGLNQFIIQNDRGSDPEFQKAMQGFQLLRGLAGSALMLAIAQPMASFLGNDSLVWAYQLMALVPLLFGLRHFDVNRFQRRMIFWPSFVCNLVGPVIGLLALWPLDWLFNDYRVVLFALLIQEGLTTLFTHLVAERPFRIRFQRSLMTEGVRFGWPLLLNGLLLFLVLQGEKLVVGRELGMAALGIFAMALALVQEPSMALQRTITQFQLPQLAANKADDAGFTRMATVTVQANLLGAVILCLAVQIFGEMLVLTALGPHYAPAIPLLVLINIVQALRGARGCTAQVALARAKTGNALAGNVPRALSIPISWYALTQGGGLATILVIAAIAEMTGFGIGLWLMRTRTGVGLRRLIPALVAFAAFLVALALHGPLGGGADALLSPRLSTGLLVAATLLFMVSILPLWRYLWKREMSGYSD